LGGKTCEKNATKTGNAKQQESLSEKPHLGNFGDKLKPSTCAQAAASHTAAKLGCSTLYLRLKTSKVSN